MLILPWFLAGGTGAGSGLSANLSGSFEEAIDLDMTTGRLGLYVKYGVADKVKSACEILANPVQS